MRLFLCYLPYPSPTSRGPSHLFLLLCTWHTLEPTLVIQIASLLLPPHAQNVTGATYTGMKLEFKLDSFNRVFPYNYTSFS